MHSEWYFSWCMQLQESQEMNREEIKKERETITLLKADIQTLVELNSPNSVGLHVYSLLEASTDQEIPCCIICMLRDVSTD